MKITLLGYGRMGKEIEKAALERNHQVILVIDAFNQQDFTVEKLRTADVAIDFSTPGSAYQNILKCFEAGIPVVCGTTGWLDKFNEVKSRCEEQNQTFFYASNYSMGVNILYAVNKFLARIMDTTSGYEVGIKEIHHIHKVDAPSGTAISLANDLISCVAGKKKWELNQASDKSVVCIDAERSGEVPGTHIITWDSAVDRIKIMHEAKSRKGLALGAILAAEFIRDKKGIYGMGDMIKLPS
jgi:4-hydroxy-tetrahydrodipicolinate reductase